MHYKKSVLLKDDLLRLCANTLPADDNYYLLNRDNLAEQIQIQLYQKQKSFSEFFFSFLKYILNFKHLPKKDDPHS